MLRRERLKQMTFDTNTNAQRGIVSDELIHNIHIKYSNDIIQTS